MATNGAYLSDERDRLVRKFATAEGHMSKFAALEYLQELADAAHDAGEFEVERDCVHHILHGRIELDQEGFTLN